MTGLVGMDVDVVRQLAQQLDRQATALEGTAQAVDRIVSQLRSVWRGTDAETFQGWWVHQHRPALTGCGEAIHGLSQSALNNATEQEGASGGSSPGETSGVGSTSGVSPAPGTAPAVPAPATQDGFIPAGRAWQDAQAGYDSWARGYWAGDGQYQCTGWARYRWHELGVALPDVRLGNGADMADGVAGVTGVPVSTQPSLHAIASYGSGYGHVMVVEEIRPDGSVRFSEMNTGSDWEVGRPEEFRDTRTITPNPDGTYSWNGQQIKFAAIPK